VLTKQKPRDRASCATSVHSLTSHSQIPFNIISKGAECSPAVSPLCSKHGLSFVLFVPSFLSPLSLSLSTFSLRDRRIIVKCESKNTSSSTPAHPGTWSAGTLQRRARRSRPVRNWKVAGLCAYSTTPFQLQKMYREAGLMVEQGFGRRKSKLKGQEGEVGADCKRLR
jgi:hypothetical protein